MRYDHENYVKLMSILDIVRVYAEEMDKKLIQQKRRLNDYLSDVTINTQLDIIATKEIIRQKKEMMVNNIDIYYYVCNLLRYPNIRSYNDFNPPCEDEYFYERLPKNFDESLITIYDRVLMRAMLESLSENNNMVTVTLDISVTEKELAIKKELIKFGSKHYFDVLHSQGIPTILS